MSDHVPMNGRFEALNLTRPMTAVGPILLKNALIVTGEKILPL